VLPLRDEHGRGNRGVGNVLFGAVPQGPADLATVPDRRFLQQRGGEGNRRARVVEAPRGERLSGGFGGRAYVVPGGGVVVLLPVGGERGGGGGVSQPGVGPGEDEGGTVGGRGGRVGARWGGVWR